MTTGNEFAYITNKKLLGFVDFEVYLLKYLRSGIRSATSRLFIQGSFAERMPLSSPGADQIEVELKPTLLDGMAHDGAGCLLDLEAIDRVATFENVNGQTYEVGAQYVEYPREIRINPRTGRPEYDRFVEGIGIQAQPDGVSVGGSNLTFTVDSLFEQGGSVGNHAGREVRVFRVVPADGALTEAVAIEVATVTHDGSNKVTTTGMLGQATPATSPSLYVVQLIGLTVYRDTASNRPSERPDEVFFIGTVEGNGGTPAVFDTSAQKVIEAQSASGVLVASLGAWADGTTNPADDLQAVLEKFVADLTSTAGARGAGKLTAPALANWADGTTNPAATLAAALAKFITDLTSSTGVRGTGKLTAPALSGSPYSLIASHLTTTLQGLMAIANDLATKQAQQYQRGILGGAVNAMIDLRDRDGFLATSIRSFAANTDNGLIVGVGEDGAIISSEDGGLTWTARTADDSYSDDFNDVIYSYAHNCFVAVGNELEIQISPTGETWTRKVAIGGGNLYAVSEADDGNVVAVGDYCVRTDFTTTSIPAQPGTPYVAIERIVDIGLIAGGPTGDTATSVARSVDGGVTWTTVDIGLESVESMAIVSEVGSDLGLVVDGRVSLANDDRQVQRTLNGTDWTLIRDYAAPVDAKHVVLACGRQLVLRAFGELSGQQHSLLRSLDGTTWQQVAWNVATIRSIEPKHRVKALRLGIDTYQIFVPHAAIGAGDPSWAVSAPWSISSLI